MIAIHAAGWRDGGKNEQQWRASLGTYVLPRLGRLRIDQITTAEVLAVLVPIWHAKPETARRVRQRIRAIMRWAIAEGYRDDDPAGEAIGAALPRNGACPRTTGRCRMPTSGPRSPGCGPPRPGPRPSSRWSF